MASDIFGFKSTYRVGEQLLMQFLHQIVVSLEQKIDRELLEQIRNVLVRRRVLNQTLHIDSIDWKYCNTIMGSNMTPTYRLLLLRLTSFFRLSSFLSCGDMIVLCLFLGLVLQGGFWCWGFPWGPSSSLLEVEMDSWFST